MEQKPFQFLHNPKRVLWSKFCYSPLRDSYPTVLLLRLWDILQEIVSLTSVEVRISQSHMSVLLLTYFSSITYASGLVPRGSCTRKSCVSLWMYGEPQVIEKHGTRLEWRELASAVTLLWSAQLRTGTTGPQSTLPMGEDDTSLTAMERKSAVFFCLAQHAWEVRRGSITKMVAPRHPQSLGRYFLEGGKSLAAYGEVEVSPEDFPWHN